MYTVKRDTGSFPFPVIIYFTTVIIYQFNTYILFKFLLEGKKTDDFEYERKAYEVSKGKVFNPGKD